MELACLIIIGIWGSIILIWKMLIDLMEKDTAHTMMLMNVCDCDNCKCKDESEVEQL